ncbi:hypothetical protein M427DRAFT_68447 [Gonapodya prolifera JEL478]|uniref:F-box domain-containing protein n=1 Tax=Gonapodya prolifera (strain JEL478) TaxID=1344416 RepID=A0A139AKI5_GONPJ|nr:hypothetical protein M427DRAFT_68447 [Gonapodya prolifera JEL478]|eukprot:KXS17302.1 hypothetical protein M427DRAFT_68447 [Gonapodya prolifera JEL478]
MERESRWPVMDVLPPQIVHRIFRNLPPSTFYSVVPRVSKAWLVNQRTAAPGNDGKVGSSISLFVCHFIPKNFLLCLPDLRYPELADSCDLVAPMYQFLVDDRSVGIVPGDKCPNGMP